MVCAAGGRHLFTLACPGGLFYDTFTETCQYPDQTICQPPCPVSKSVTASQQSTVTQEKSTTTPDMSSVTDGDSTKSTVTDDTLTSQQMTVSGQGSITREGMTLTGMCALRFLKYSAPQSQKETIW